MWLKNECNIKWKCNSTIIDYVYELKALDTISRSSCDFRVPPSIKRHAGAVSGVHRFKTKKYKVKRFIMPNEKKRRKLNNENEISKTSNEVNNFENEASK